MATYSSDAVSVARRPLWARTLLTVPRTIRVLKRYPVLPVIILTIIVVGGVFAPLLERHPPRVADLPVRNTPPMWEEGGDSDYILGTDHLGRDIYSRLLHGARISLIIAIVCLAVGGGIGVVLGLISGYYGGWIDEIIQRAIDVKRAMPLFLLALVAVLTFGASFTILVVVLSLSIWGSFARMIRGEVLSIRAMDYVSLARVAGASTPRILFKHILPGVIPTLTVLASLEVGVVILIEASLSFLGAGAPPPTPAWGSMVAEGRTRLAIAWWMSTMPGLAILFTVLAMNLLGDWLRDYFDPRLRQL